MQFVLNRYEKVEGNLVGMVNKFMKKFSILNHEGLTGGEWGTAVDFAKFILHNKSA